MKILKWLKEKWIIFKKKAKPYMTPKMVLVFGSVWILTTGWAHAFVIVGLKMGIGWMYKVGLGAEAFFWNPLVNEKLITIPFSIWLYKKIFKEDEDIKKIESVMESERGDQNENDKR